ncbi:hypothetical protein HMN09_00311500 [Mycena chlorophos]|uniref:Uncharacterized protein n=1 Tax=Mycena chlorophos TaxID=658473 RepID=A0A8H6TLU4_MYCCL|nr:hypothetical protein HMN09_00311500 [Mycena chlorophos]
MHDRPDAVTVKARATSTSKASPNAARTRARENHHLESAHAQRRHPPNVVLRTLRAALTTSRATNKLRRVNQPNPSLKSTDVQIVDMASPKSFWTSEQLSGAAPSNTKRTYINGNAQPRIERQTIPGSQTPVRGSLHRDDVSLEAAEHDQTRQLTHARPTLRSYGKGAGDFKKGFKVERARALVSSGNVKKRGWDSRNALRLTWRNKVMQQIHLRPFFVASLFGTTLATGWPSFRTLVGGAVTDTRTQLDALPASAARNPYPPPIMVPHLQTRFMILCLPTASAHELGFEREDSRGWRSPF